MNTTTKPYRLDTLGFPGTNCPRCNGLGSIAAYHNVFHGTCFQCNGTGIKYPTKLIEDAARTAHRQAKGRPTDNPINIEEVAADCRARYERTLARRAGRPEGPLDADTRRVVAAVRNILDSTDTDHDKLLDLARLYNAKRTSTAARGVRDKVRAIHFDRSDPSRGREETLTAIGDYIDSLTA